MLTHSSGVLFAAAIRSRLLTSFRLGKQPNILFKLRTKMSEVEKAHTAIRENDTIFGKIVRKEIPAKIIFENEEVMAFHDVNPQAPVHFFSYSEEENSNVARSGGFGKMWSQQLWKLSNFDEALLGKLLVTAAKVARDLGLERGYRVVVNNGVDGCQSVFHLHLHVLGGRQLGWPPG
ncbi:histidine triad domain protein [Dictyocaulus viviparus]|uniref:Histidine triad domain protein n=1 Tax=Dictyocaulus viviparus TaxID=29172 RepID=A0A0D8Y980_DICVI|nr:histidine triad domain protein [Dictyocaulus viviparus]